MKLSSIGVWESDSLVALLLVPPESLCKFTYPVVFKNGEQRSDEQRSDARGWNY